ncbi:MAG TPA: hypothetical protein VK808_12470 [Bacteroidia bacterium]|nr:hypothetical protein [Bacteroidia bacterium]
MSRITKRKLRVLLAVTLFYFILPCFYACQKANPTPYEDLNSNSTYTNSNTPEAVFTNTKFYIFGNGNYGTLNSSMAEARLLIKLSQYSPPIRIN